MAYRDKDWDGYHPACRCLDCIRFRKKLDLWSEARRRVCEYRIANAEKIKKTTAAWRIKNGERLRCEGREYYRRTFATRAAKRKRREYGRAYRIRKTAEQFMKGIKCPRRKRGALVEEALQIATLQSILQRLKRANSQSMGRRAALKSLKKEFEQVRTSLFSCPT